MRGIEDFQSLDKITIFFVIVGGKPPPAEVREIVKARGSDGFVFCATNQQGCPTPTKGQQGPALTDEIFDRIFRQVGGGAPR